MPLTQHLQQKERIAGQGSANIVGKEILDYVVIINNHLISAVFCNSFSFFPPPKRGIDTA